MPSVSVTAASRLHFGMLSFGRPDTRQFGGLGLMVDWPGLRLRMTPADRLTATGPHADRALQFAARAIAALEQEEPERFTAGPQTPAIEILSAPRQHTGLGVGTQLGLAIAAGCAALVGHSGPVDSAQLARWSGRGERSSIGLYGFLHGGLLLEAGKIDPRSLSPLIARAELPENWRFVLLVPRESVGLFGETERQAFHELPPVPCDVTDELCRLATLDIIPAATDGDFAAFSRSLYEFGHLAGRCFASRQCGAFLNEQTAAVVQKLRDLGIEGVGQTSWGPTIFAAVESPAAGESLIAALQGEAELADYELILSAPTRRGVIIEAAQP